MGTITDLAFERYRGPSPTFSELHMVRAVQVLGQRRVMGRTLLSEELGLGLGAIRTLINHLKALKIVKIERAGCRLTDKGLGIYEGLSKKIHLISGVYAGKLSMGRHDVAVLVRGAGHRVRVGIEQRDAAIKAAASGATTLLFREGKFAMPMGSNDCAKDFPDRVWAELQTRFRPQDNDVIIVCSAMAEEKAGYGALAAALTLF